MRQDESAWQPGNAGVSPAVPGRIVRDCGRDARAPRRSLARSEVQVWDGHRDDRHRESDGEHESAVAHEADALRVLAVLESAPRFEGAEDTDQQREDGDRPENPFRLVVADP